MSDNPKCPYCGGTMRLIHTAETFWLFCPDCFASSPIAGTPSDVYAAAMKMTPECLPNANWHKFDVNDLGTYPQAYKSKLLFHRDGYVEEGEWLGAAEKWHQYHPNDVLKPDEVLYWCDMPKPPMEWMLENCCCFGEANDE